MTHRQPEVWRIVVIAQCVCHGGILQGKDLETQAAFAAARLGAYSSNVYDLCICWSYCTLGNDGVT